MTVATMFNFIAVGDHKLMRKLNSWSAPQWIRWWAVAATRAGDGWLWSFFGVLVLLFGGKARFAALASAGSAAVIGIAVFLSVKRVSGRKRPCEIQPHCWAKLLPPDRFSFPSGHTITAFAVAGTLALFYPALLPVLLFCAVSIALSRVLLGMHFMSDVLAGTGIGLALAFGAYVVFA
jgi:undecaprenyl-diphosphatase